MNDILAPRVRTMQIVLAALLMGPIIFCVVCLILVENNGPMWHGQSRNDLPVFSIFTLAMLAVSVPTSLVVANFLVRSAVRRIASGHWSVPYGADPAIYASDEAKLLPSRHTALIAASALLESVGFMGSFAYLMEGTWYALAAVAVPAAFMIWQFPTLRSTRDWLDRHVALVAELRELGPFGMG